MGPNGSMIYAVQHFVDENQAEMGEFFGYEDDFLLVDCPGQVELFLQYDCFRVLAHRLGR